jgi:hypothetical protein
MLLSCQKLWLGFQGSKNTKIEYQGGSPIGTWPTFLVILAIGSNDHDPYDTKFQYKN